ncbi:hypothetical protein C7M84_010744 [Penaeus vannamei]|uniref:Calponin-homology (CH) domain-containing protein n=1 Tax=Penaeus vannamei TaxID=6689 RepID=A0A423T3H5_PENVA|nr:hypothetical protein C7M84_010744 [Penaeus vannamei]
MKGVSSGEKTTPRGAVATMEPNPAAVASEWLWWTWSWLTSLACSVWSWWVELWDLCYPYLCLAWMYITTSVIRGQSEEKRLLTWVQDLVPTRRVEDLDLDLADGVALCGLMQALVPGTCPRHDLLPPDQPAGNIRLASRLASTFLGVTQDLAWERMQGRDGHRNLMRFLRHLRYSSLKREVLGGPAVTHDSVVEALGDYQELQVSGCGKVCADGTIGGCRRQTPRVTLRASKALRGPRIMEYHSAVSISASGQSILRANPVPSETTTSYEF